MKNILAFIFLILFSSCGYILGNSGPMDSLDYDDQKMYEIIGEVSKDLSKKYGFYPCAFGGSSNLENKWTNVSVSYKTDTFWSLDEGAKIVIEAARLLRDKINDNEDAQQYLSCIPFRIENVSVSLIFPDDLETEGLQLISIRCSGNAIHYLYADLEDYSQRSSTSEPYEEAVKRLNLFEDE